MPKHEELIVGLEEDVDLRTIGSRVDFLDDVGKEYDLAKPGQCVSFRNRKGNRFRHVVFLFGRPGLYISAFDPKEKYSLALKESETLAQLARFKELEKRFMEIRDEVALTKARSDAIKRGRKK